MIFGMPRTRALIYLCAIIALLVALFWQSDAQQTPGDTSAPGPVAGSRVTELPEIFAARDFLGYTAPQARDLFAARPPAPPIVAAPAPEPAPAAPDPAEIARQEVTKTFDSISVLGILGSDSGPVAVLEFGGNVISATREQEVLPGYIVQTISLDHLVLRHASTGMERIYLMGTSDN